MNFEHIWTNFDVGFLTQNEKVIRHRRDCCASCKMCILLNFLPMKTGSTAALHTMLFIID